MSDMVKYRAESLKKDHIAALYITMSAITIFTEYSRCNTNSWHLLILTKRKLTGNTGDNYDDIS